MNCATAASRSSHSLGQPVDLALEEERLDDRQADTAAGSDDNDDLVLQVQIHDYSL
jgi:hypothetical protein